MQCSAVGSDTILQGISCDAEAAFCDMSQFLCVQLFTRRSARILFQNMRLQRWCFDVELVYLAHRLQIPIAEENVTWHEIAGSKIRFWSIASMAFDLFIVKTAYLSGAWSVMGEAAARNS